MGLKHWTTDSLHSLLGFADSALASYLIHVASKGDVDAVLQTLKEGGVDITSKGGWRDFATELVGKAGGKSPGHSKREGDRTVGGKRVTESEMRKKAAGYTLLDMQDEPLVGEIFLYTHFASVISYIDDLSEMYTIVMTFSDPSCLLSIYLFIPYHALQSLEHTYAVASTYSISSFYRRFVLGKPSGDGTVITKSSRGSSRKKERREKESKTDQNDRNSRSNRSHKDSNPDRAESDKSSSTSKRRRRRHSESESEDEVVIDEEALWEHREKRRDELRRKKKKSSEVNDEEQKLRSLTEEERAELEREKDKRERDEFAKRLIEKDKKRQRQLNESDDDSRNEEREAQRMERLKKREDRDRRLARGEAVVLDSDGDEGDSSKKKKAISISDMRAESRRAYLQKRTKRELELLERELQDEEEIIAKLGGSSKMTEEEKKELQLKREILRMAREHGHVENDEAEAAKKPDGFYRLPEDFDADDDTGRKKTRAQKGEELLTSRYVEPKQEKSEQQLWEEGQTQMAAGLSRQKKKKRSGEDEDDGDKYDFVFEEEQIDFVCVDTNKGYDNRKKHLSKAEDASVEVMNEDEKALEMRPATKHEKILEGRKKLPVYPYRDDFLMALKDHQVLVLVGETGSGEK